MTTYLFVHTFAATLILLHHAHPYNSRQATRLIYFESGTSRISEGLGVQVFPGFQYPSGRAQASPTSAPAGMVEERL